MSFIGSEVSKLLQVVKGFAARTAPAMLAQTQCAQLQDAQRECLFTFAQGFAERALRRPARAEEAELYRKILGLADGTSAADQSALEGLLTTVFFAPSFLYRTELGAPVAGSPGKRVLQGGELAAKLSFFASLGPPDQELLALANGGRLSDGAERAKQFERLTQTSAGKHAQSVFVLEWLGANESKIGQKSDAYLSGLSPDFAAAARASADAFVQTVLAGPTPTLTQLLTGTSYLSDPALKQVTQASNASGVATGDVAGFERLGLLMHPQVMAAHTKENGSSPFQLGYFLKEVLLCEKVAAPPAGATALAKQDEPSGLSMRESLEYRTSANPVCSGCHAQFAPLGFSFMAFDPIGRWVSRDPSGKPWDLSGTVATASGEPLAFNTPAEMLRGVAERPQTQGCFAQTALEWSLGRGLVADDKPAILALDKLLTKSGGNVPAIMKTIVGAPEFLNVAPLANR